MSSSPQYRFSRQSHHLGQRNEPTLWQRIHIDPWLTLLLLTVCCIGLTILYSASSQDGSMVIRQVVSYGVAFGVMFAIAQVPPSIYRTFTPIFYVLGLVLLVLVDIIGEVRMGAQRWINLPGFGSVQPSEFMKLGMPMMAEMQLTTDNIKNSFPMSFASNAGINSLLGMMNFYQLPDSYLTDYVSRIDQVQLSGVNQTMRDTLKPENFLIVTVGQDNPWEKKANK